VSQTSPNAWSTEESTPCALSTKIEPDSRGLDPRIHLEKGSPLRAFRTLILVVPGCAESAGPESIATVLGRLRERKSRRTTLACGYGFRARRVACHRARWRRAAMTTTVGFRFNCQTAKRTNLRIPAARKCVRVLQDSRPRRKRAQGMPGALLHPQPCVRMGRSTQAKSLQVRAEHRHSLRNGFNGCFVFSPVCRAF
jgi:hypothetical protein